MGRRADRSVRLRQRDLLRLGRSVLVRPDRLHAAGRVRGDRWEEFWNLVFMEFDQQPDGSRPLLPNPTVDTGLGFDRIVAIVQGDRTGYGTDHFAPLGRRLPVSGRRAVAEPRQMRSLYVLADHLRGAGFLISAGVLPANEGRGYVLRRLVRRAAVHARRVGAARRARGRNTGPRRRDGPGLPGARRVPSPHRGDARASRRRRSREPWTRGPSASPRCSRAKPASTSTARTRFASMTPSGSQSS